jgi:RND family efflux transporter MFP subunit
VLRPLIALALTIAATPACTDANEAKGKPPAKPVVVQVIAAREEHVERAIDITGTLAGAEEVVVSAEVDGRVERIVADLGDVVAAGATIVQLARETPRLQAAQADADYATALARVGVADAGLDDANPDLSSIVRRATADRDEARRILERTQELAAKGVAAQADLDVARTRSVAADAALAAAREEAMANVAVARSRRATLGLAQKRLADTAVKSPVDAVVATRLVSLGELVQPGTPVARVVVVKRLKLRGDVPERYADVVQPGLELDLEVDGVTAPQRAKVARVGPLVDGTSRTFPIEAAIDNANGHFKPGTFARARVVVGADEVVFAVPEVAVSNVAGVAKVFVVDDGVAAERKVQLLRKRGSDALVTGSLKAGEQVIVTAIARLFGGAPVVVETAPPAAPAAGAAK